jgi:hypothetical protein
MIELREDPPRAFAENGRGALYACFTPPLPAVMVYDSERIPETT